MCFLLADWIRKSPGNFLFTDALGMFCATTVLFMKKGFGLTNKAKVNPIDEHTYAPAPFNLSMLFHSCHISWERILGKTKYIAERGTFKAVRRSRWWCWKSALTRQPCWSNRWARRQELGKTHFNAWCTTAGICDSSPMKKFNKARELTECSLDDRCHQYSDLRYCCSRQDHGRANTSRHIAQQRSQFATI